MILDTNAISALLAGDPGIAEVLAGAQRHQIPTVVLGEYRYGLKRSRRRDRIERWLSRLEDECDVLPVDRVTARYYADVRHRLQKAGRPIPENDVWIAALALQHQLPVVSADQHLDGVPELTRIGWQRP